MGNALKFHKDLPQQAVADTRFNTDRRIVTMLRLETVSSIAQKLLRDKKVGSMEDALAQAKMKIEATR